MLIGYSFCPAPFACRLTLFTSATMRFLIICEITLGARCLTRLYSLREWCWCRESDLKRYIENAVEVDPDRPVLVDKYLDRADELDVDALCDKDGHVTICGIMQHIEQAGVHSGEPPSRVTPPECCSEASAARQ